LLAEAVSSEMSARRPLDIERTVPEQRCIKDAEVVKIPPGQMLKNFAFAFQPAVERSRIKTLATGARVRSGKVFRLKGSSGLGKSQLPECLNIPRSGSAYRFVTAISAFQRASVEMCL